MKKTSKIISIIMTVAMLMGLMTSVSFAAQTLPATFGWSATNAGYITIDVPDFEGEEIEYYLDLYKDGEKISHDFGVFFDASGIQESEVFVEKINELGDGTYKYKIGFSRDFDTDELIDPTAFSSEYVKVTENNEPSDLPYNLTWDISESGSIQFCVPEHIDGRIKYKVVLYKNGVKVNDTTLSVWGNTLDDTRIMSHGCMADEIYDNGSGIYTYTLSTLDNLNNPLETTVFSSEFNYNRPLLTLPVPTNIVLTENDVQWTPVDNEYCGGYWVDFYVAYPTGDKYFVYGQEVKGRNTSNESYVSDNDVARYSQEQIDRMYNINPNKYPKESAYLAVTVQALTTDMCIYNSSDISGYVSLDGEEDNGNNNEEEDTPNTSIDRSSVSEEYYNAAKVMYDLGIMPDIYTNSKNNVKKSELYGITNSIVEGRESTSTEDVTAGIVAERILGMLERDEVAEVYGSTYYYAHRLGLFDGVVVRSDSTITHEELAQILYNALSIPLMEKVGYNSYNDTDKTFLTEYLDIAKITANITVNGNTAAVSGLKVDEDNLTGIEIKNQSIEIGDEEILDYADGGLLLFVKDGVILSGIELDAPFFIINGGAQETENTTLSINLYAKGYTKYKFVDDESDVDTPYTPIASGFVSHTISNADGKHTIKIEFANENESLVKEVTNNIKLNNKQTITFMVNGSVFKTEEQGCGNPIVLPSVNVNGYWFKGWSVPSGYIVPDEDITVTANLIPLATIKGKLIDIEGNPVPYGYGVFIDTRTSYGNNNGYVMSYTNSDGEFELVCPQGEYLMNVSFFEHSKTVEVNANQAVVDVGEIRETLVLPTISAQYQVEKVKGFLEIYESLVTEEEVANMPEGGRYLVLCSAGSRLVIGDDAEIAQTIKADCGDDAAVYYIYIGISKEIKTARGDYENYAEIYETPQLLEFVINIPDEVKNKDEYVIYRKHTTPTEDGAVTTIEKITKEANEFGEYLTVADGKINLFVKRFSDYAIVGVDNEEPNQQPTYRPSGSVSSGSTTVSVPNGTGADVKATVSGTTATISKIDTTKVSEETSYAIDMSGVEKTVNSVKLPTSAVKDLIKEGSKVETLDIKLRSGSVSFDTAALKTISEVANGSQITLNIDGDTSNLTTDEKNAIKQISSPTVVDVSLTSGNKIISDFEGGKAVVSVPFELKEGQIAESVIAQHIGENGILTAMETSYDNETNTVSFVAPHFSKYVVSAVYEKDAVVLNIGKKDAKVFGETITNDVAPKIVNERTMLPIRFIAEKLGASVDWAEETQTVTVELNDIKISLVIGDGFAMVNDEKIELDSASFEEDGRTFLPIRFVMENLGANVLWHNDTQTVIITK